MGAIVAEVERLVVRKTYKLYIGGKFPRTESGRSYLVSDSRGRPLANACRGSRKDVRDAGRAAVDAVDKAIDRWVWYAGWADKITQVLGSANPVAGPYFNFSVPEPTGVVGLVAPADSSLLGLVSRLAPVIVSGNTSVVLASQDRPLPAVTLAEVLATSDLPGGVVNLLTGFAAELVKPLAAH